MCQKHYQRFMRGAKIKKYEYDDEPMRVVEVSEAEIRRQKIERAKWEVLHTYRQVERNVRNRRTNDNDHAACTTIR